MSETRRFATHVRNYSLASVLSLVAGLLSFPLLTRLLPVEEYGLMSLVSATLTFAVAFGKLGMQRSTLRFYNEVHHGHFPGVTEASFLSTVFHGMAAMGLVAMLLWLGAAAGLPLEIWFPPQMRILMYITAALVFSRVLDSAFNNLLQAQERSGSQALYGVLRRYSLLLATLGMVYFVSSTAAGFFTGMLVAELGALLVIGWLYFRSQWPRWQDISGPMLKAMLVFSVPMAGYELSAIFIQLGDRYVLQSAAGAASVGLYSAAYNLAAQFEQVVFSSLVGAAVPMCLRLRERDGMAAVNAFLHDMTRFYGAVGVCAVAATAAVRHDLMLLLASSKYEAAADLVPVILTGRFMDASVALAAMGLYLARRTVTTMLVLLAGALLNIGINLVMVPRAGIMAAAVTHAFSLTAVVAMLMLLGRSEGISAGLFEALAGFAVAGVAGFLAAAWLDSGSPWLNVPLRALLVVLVYVAVAWAVVPGARPALGTAFDRLRQRLG